MLFRSRMEGALLANAAFIQSVAVMWFSIADPFVRMMLPPSRATQSIDHIESSAFGEHMVYYLRPLGK